MTKKIKPFLKWAGSKFRCLEHIQGILPPAQRLIEPFAGSGVVFLNANYSAYLLGEENIDLVNLFQQLKAEGKAFIEYCESFFNKDNNCSQKYYQLRAEFNQSKDQRERSALFLFLNRHGYNGLCRYNQNALYNVPFGRHEKPYFPRLELEFFYQKSQQAEFFRGDFRETFAKARSGDVIYCDPPYVPLSASANFSAYTQRKFTHVDQLALAQLARESAAKGIPVIISNHDTPLTRACYQSSKIISFEVRRLISCHSTQRHAVKELLALFI